MNHRVNLNKLIVKSYYNTEITHTGQNFSENDFRRSRFVDSKKIVNQKFAIKLISESQTQMISGKRVISCDGGGSLGHPKVFINLDKHGIHSCVYCGQKFSMNTSH